MKEKKDINIVVGAHIKRERERAGYTQERFSEMIGIGPKSLSAIERGTVGISLSLLQKVCRVLSVSSDSLLFESSGRNDVGALVDRLERLDAKKFALASDILNKVLEAFELEN
mgnify:CR=1 FL=1